MRGEVFDQDGEKSCDSGPLHQVSSGSGFSDSGVGGLYFLFMVLDGWLLDWAQKRQVRGSNKCQGAKSLKHLGVLEGVQGLDFHTP